MRGVAAAIHRDENVSTARYDARDPKAPFLILSMTCVYLWTLGRPPRQTDALGILATRFYTYGYAVPIFPRDIHYSQPGDFLGWHWVPLTGPRSIGMQN